MAKQDGPKTLYRFDDKTGGTIAGIPARDLTERDWARLTPQQRREVLASGLYDATKAAPRQPTADDDQTPTKGGTEGDTK